MLTNNFPLSAYRSGGLLVANQNGMSALGRQHGAKAASVLATNNVGAANVASGYPQADTSTSRWFKLDISV